MRRAAKLVNEKAADQLQTAAEGFERLMELALPGRLEEIPEDLGYALMALRDACRTVISAIGATRDKSVQDEDAVRKQALASVESVHDVAERITHGSEWDVVWYERHEPRGGAAYRHSGASLRVAPMSVSGLLREKLFTDRSVVLTSATLKLGGDFNGVGASLGLGPEGAEGDDLPQWKGVDVGSPFDYPRQGILYVAKHLARPARDGDRKDMLDELTELIQAGRRPHAGAVLVDAGGSARGGGAAVPDPGVPDPPSGRGDARRADQEFRGGPADVPVRHAVAVAGRGRARAQLSAGGDGQDPVPASGRPLMSARQKAVEEAGGNGFMAVAATHAALLMAQGAGRLVRASGDRGVVAVLDPRLATARYGSYLKASMPDFWYTTDRNQVRKSLAAIDAAAE